jgi:lipoate-protein ligase A
MKWRLIRNGKLNPYVNMGIDEALLDSVARGRSLPTLRLYMWSPSTVSIGRFQALDEAVNAQACSELGIPVIRRVSGGGSVFHDENGEVTYSVAMKEDVIKSRDFIDSFKFVLGGVVEALGGLGVHAEFAPINDVVVEGRKVSGSAQVRRDGAVLQHGTVLLDIDRDKAFRALRVPEMKLQEKSLHDPADRVTTLKALGVKVDQEGLSRALVKGFSSALGAEFTKGRLTAWEKGAATAYAQGRYAERSWLEGR